VRQGDDRKARGREQRLGLLGGGCAESAEACEPGARQSACLASRARLAQRIVGKVSKRYADMLDTFCSSANPLPSGRWTVVLTIDGRIAKQIDVLHRSSPPGTSSFG